MMLAEKTHSTTSLSSEDLERQQRINSGFSQLRRMIGAAVCKKNTEEIQRRVEKKHRHNTPLVHKMIA